MIYPTKAAARNALTNFAAHMQAKHVILPAYERPDGTRAPRPLGYFLRLITKG
jgi:hypothetical protein